MEGIHGSPSSTKTLFLPGACDAIGSKGRIHSPKSLYTRSRPVMEYLSSCKTAYGPKIHCIVNIRVSLSHRSSKLHKPKVIRHIYYVYLSPPAPSAYGGPVTRGTDKLDSRKHWLDLGACQLLALLGIIQ